MKSLSKVLSAVCIILGATIGAGFATGKEIHNFFFGFNPFYVALFSLVFFSILIYLILHFARKTSAVTIKQVLGGLFGKFSAVIESFIVLCYFLVTSTMLAAANTCVTQFFGISEKIPVFSCFTAVICAFALLRPSRGIKVVNIVCIPFMLVFIVIICLGEQLSFSTTSVLPLVPCLAYACFNCLMMLGILLPTATQLTKRESLWVAVLSAVVISLLIYLIMKRTNDEVFSVVPMPLISIARGYGKLSAIISTIIFYLSVFTSVVSGTYPVTIFLAPIVGNDKISIILVLFFSLIFSTVGFSVIIDKIYPLMAVLGIALFVFMLAKELLCIVKRNLLPVGTRN